MCSVVTGQLKLKANSPTTGHVAVCEDVWVVVTSQSSPSPSPRLSSPFSHVALCDDSAVALNDDSADVLTRDDDAAPVTVTSETWMVSVCVGADRTQVMSSSPPLQLSASDEDTETSGCVLDETSLTWLDDSGFPIVPNAINASPSTPKTTPTRRVTSDAVDRLRDLMAQNPPVAGYVSTVRLWASGAGAV